MWSRYKFLTELSSATFHAPCRFWRELKPPKMDETLSDVCTLKDLQKDSEHVFGTRRARRSCLDEAHHRQTHLWQTRRCRLVHRTAHDMGKRMRGTLWKMHKSSKDTVYLPQNFPHHQICWWIHTTGATMIQWCHLLLLQTLTVFVELSILIFYLSWGS